MPRNCYECAYQSCCNAVMYTKGCTYFSPESEKKNSTWNRVTKFFAKFFS